MGKNKSSAPDDSGNMELPPVLDILAAEKLKEDLKIAIAGDQIVQIDASQVSRVSTACLQILVAAKKVTREAREATDKNADMQINTPSDSFNTAIQNLGLEKFLENGVIENAS